ncbi:MAG: hypothetical protein JSU79_05990 [Dehalococcoidales bacterium]|nr:MAG: hypothetical protein JSU79_05990 [Dehalococcoidales bacterium]
MEKIETILTDCIRDIKSGKATLAECLDRYDSRRNELEPLLKMALSVHELPEFKLNSSHKQAVKTQMLYNIQFTRQKNSRSFTDIFSFGIPYQSRWARVAVSIIVVVILLSTLAGGTAYAAQDSLPGDFLYPVKVRTEDARLLMAGDESNKAKLSLNFAQTRLDEMSELMKTDQERVGLIVDGYKANLNTAFQQIQKVTNTSDQADLLIEASEKMQFQLEFCDNVIDGNPATSKPVYQVSNLTISQKVQFLRMLSQLNTLKAVQLNFGAMENRIRRARSKADGSQYQAMQESLLQYQQFNRLGEQILRNAQISNNQKAEIETLSEQALSSYLDIIDSFSQEVPQKYQESLETCRQMTRQFQTQARHKYQEQGSTDSGPGGDTDNPGSGPREPGSGPGEPNSGNGKSGTEPGNGNGKTDNGNDGSGNGAGEPGSGAGEPGSDGGEPGSGNDDPGNGR